MPICNTTSRLLRKWLRITKTKWSRVNRMPFSKNRWSLTCETNWVRLSKMPRGLKWTIKTRKILKSKIWTIKYWIWTGRIEHSKWNWINNKMISCTKGPNWKTNLQNSKAWSRTRIIRLWRWSNRYKTQSCNRRNKWRQSMQNKWKATNTKKRLRNYENRWSNYNRSRSKARGRRRSRMTQPFRICKKNRVAVWPTVSRMWAPIRGKFWKVIRMLAQVVGGTRDTNRRKVKLGIISWLKVNILTRKVRKRSKLLHSNNPFNIRCTHSTRSPNKLFKKKSRWLRLLNP